MLSDKEIGSTANNQQSIIRWPPYPIELMKKHTIQRTTKLLSSSTMMGAGRTRQSMSTNSSIQWDCMLEEERITFVSLCNNTKQNVNEGVVEFIRRFMDTALDCYDNNEEHELVEACINNMLSEYRLHLENLNIVQFVDLLQKA
uniref:Uncharacterized protein n=1 Tax=Quercus lobata TaxID=97700 RepID=A0A7N2LLY3_QUELO